MKKPNFFIVGAPKCGTTALSEYLRMHPQVFISEPKEPLYFAKDFSNQLRTLESLPDYLALFKNCSNSHLAVGEASTWYLYSSVALRRIYEFNPKAKIIVMFRNPVDLVYSLHLQLLYNLEEDQRDFETAWSLQASRTQGVHIPEKCREPNVLQYARIGKLGEQIERLLTIFAPAQIQTLLFDDFTSAPQRIYQEVLAFLELPFDGRKDFPRLNESKSHRFPWLALFERRPPWHIAAKFQPLKRFLGLERLSFLRILTQLNIRRHQRPPLRPEFRQELVEEFRDDIELLSRLIQRDLRHWSSS